MIPNIVEKYHTDSTKITPSTPGAPFILVSPHDDNVFIRKNIPDIIAIVNII